MTLYKGFIFLLTTTYVTLISTTACKNSSSMIENQARKWTQSLRICTTSFGVDIHNGLEFKHKYLPAMLKSDLDDSSFLRMLNDKIMFQKKYKILTRHFYFLYYNLLSITKPFPFAMSCLWSANKGLNFDELSIT